MNLQQKKHGAYDFDSSFMFLLESKGFICWSLLVAMRVRHDNGCGVLGAKIVPVLPSLPLQTYSPILAFCSAPASVKMFSSVICHRFSSLPVVRHRAPKL